MSRLGKIVLENNSGIPKVIITEGGRFPSGIELVQECPDRSSIKISASEIERINYRGKKLGDCKAKLNNVMIYNLNLREIGALTSECYCRLLRQYISYQASLGGTEPNYQMVRTEVQTQLIKLMK